MIAVLLPEIAYCIYTARSGEVFRLWDSVPLEGHLFLSHWQEMPDYTTRNDFFRYLFPFMLPAEEFLDAKTDD